MGSKYQQKYTLNYAYICPKNYTDMLKPIIDS